MIIITTASGASYPIDLALEERLSYTAEVSEDAVEKGAAITDHIRPKQPVLSFDGVVSDTPIGRVALDPSRQVSAGSPLPSMDAYQRFVAIHEAGEPVTVKCSYGTFDSMALASLTPTKDSKSAKAFKFTVEFRRIEIVENKRVTVRMAVRNGNAKQSLGNKESQEWQNKTGLAAGTIFVYAFPESQRDGFSKSWGQPVWTDNGTDYYQIVGQAKPSGYLVPNTSGGKQYTYHPITDAGFASPYQASSTTSVPTSIAGRPVHYDYGDNAWHDDRNNSVVRTVPVKPGDPGYNEAKWKGVTYGNNPPGTG